MTTILPCPKCREPLEVPRPAPDQLRCNFCGAVIKNTPRKPAEATKVPAAEATAIVEPAAVGTVAARSRNKSAAAAEAPRPQADAPRIQPAAPREALAAKPPAGNTGTLIGLSVAVLLVAGLGGVAVWKMMQEEDRPPPLAQKEPEAPPKKEEEPEEDIRLSITFAKKEKVKKPLDPRVQKAVDAGVAFLRTKTPDRDRGFAKNEHALGMVALSGLTMLECGAAVDDPDVLALAKAIRDNLGQLTSTYTAGPAILFLDRLHKDKAPPEEDRKLIQILALRLISAQKKGNGLWGYAAPALISEAAVETKTAPGKKKQPKKAVKKVEENLLLAELTTNTYEPRGLGGFDLSNSQFAALALWASRRHGVPVDPALRIASKTIREGQDKKTGTWGYRIEGSHRDSGTCVGLILLALGRAVAEEKKEAKAPQEPIVKDPAVVDALNHLGKIVHRDAKIRTKKGKARRPIMANSGGDLYFMWALERTALILNIETIDGVNWHAWGTEIILDMQLKDGSWMELPNHGTADTCFALLFLMQANLFQDLTDKLEGLADGDARPVAVPPEKK